MDIEQMTRGQIEAEFAALARTMYFTKSTIAAFSKDATRGQLVAACELIRSENAIREENRKARLMRQAKFPAVKSVADFDFGEVSFPDGYTVDDLVSLEFVRQAQDFVFYGGCGRGKTHLSIALGVLAAERVPKTDKLLKLTIDTGIDERTIVSGIAEYYSPEDMLGKQICILANLAPRKIRGIESKGMILMAKQGDGKMRFITPAEVVTNGAQIG